MRRNSECVAAVASTPDGTSTSRGTPASASSGCVHPQKKSETTATTGPAASPSLEPERPREDRRSHTPSGARSAAACAWKSACAWKGEEGRDVADKWTLPPHGVRVSKTGQQNRPMVENKQF